MSFATDPTQPSPLRCSRCGFLFGAHAVAGLCPRCLLLDPDLPEDVEDDPSSLPSRFGGYERLSPLGEGGVGVVFKARQESSGRIVALKCLRDGDFADAVERRRFRREARDMASLDHPNIVPVYDVGQHEGQLYFTMKLMAGGTLRGAAARFADPRRAAALIATLARAVHAVHTGRAGHPKRILHRDLKPENILFDDRETPYVGDFGIAQCLDPGGTDRTLTWAGTIPYMAPELVAGPAKHLTAAVDVWSLGVILYELLAGRQPFEGPTPAEVFRRIADEEPEPLDRLRRDVGRDLVTVCLTCLRKEPGQRYISAEALADDLDRVLRGEPALARRPGRVERARRWCGRHPTAAAVLGAAAVALVSLTLWAAAGARAQERARRAEVLAANTYAARAVAGTVLHQLDEYAGVVAAEAREPALDAALARDDDAAIQAHCETLVGRHDGLVYWFVVDTAGRLRALVPSERFHVHDGRNYSFRDYFRGTMALPAGADRPVYVSRAFFSTSDHRYKLGLSAPIRGEGGTIRALLVAEIATDRRLGALALSDDRRVAALAVRHDREQAGAPLPEEHILWVHGGVAHGEGVIVESAALRRLTARRDAAGPAGPDQLHLPPPDWVEAEDGYRDPLAARDPHGDHGPWLAGVAAVGRTELSVIVQTRVDDAMAINTGTRSALVAWPVGGVLLLFASLFALLRKRVGARAA